MIDLHHEIKSILNGKTLIVETASKLALEPTITTGVLEKGFKRPHLVNFVTTALCSMTKRDDRRYLSEAELREQLYELIHDAINDFVKYHRDYAPKTAVMMYFEKLQTDLHAITSELSNFEIEEEAQEEPKAELPKDRQAYEMKDTVICKNPDCRQRGRLKVRKQDNEFWEVVSHRLDNGKETVHRQRVLTAAEAKERLKDVRDARRAIPPALDGLAVKGQREQRVMTKGSTIVMDDIKHTCKRCNEKGYLVAYSESKGKGRGRRYYHSIHHGRGNPPHRIEPITEKQFKEESAIGSAVPFGQPALAFWKALDEKNKKGSE